MAEPDRMPPQWRELKIAQVDAAAERRYRRRVRALNFVTILAIIALAAGALVARVALS